MELDSENHEVEIPTPALRPAKTQESFEIQDGTACF